VGALESPAECQRCKAGGLWDSSRCKGILSSLEEAHKQIRELTMHLEDERSRRQDIETRARESQAHLERLSNEQTFRLKMKLTQFTALVKKQNNQLSLDENG
jgi:hypothetical protein